jgi:hypothetical protein
MNNRDAQMKAWREYQEALHEAMDKKPEVSWYSTSIDEGLQYVNVIYDPAADLLTLRHNNDYCRIPGRYFKAFQEALGSILEEKRS